MNAILSLLLLARKDKHSVLFQDIFPLDIFKIIFFISKHFWNQRKERLLNILIIDNELIDPDFFVSFILNNFINIDQLFELNDTQIFSVLIRACVLNNSDIKSIDAESKIKNITNSMLYHFLSNNPSIIYQNAKDNINIENLEEELEYLNSNDSIDDINFVDKYQDYDIVVELLSLLKQNIYNVYLQFYIITNIDDYEWEYNHNIESILDYDYIKNYDRLYSDINAKNDLKYIF